MIWPNFGEDWKKKIVREAKNIYILKKIALFSLFLLFFSSFFFFYKKRVEGKLYRILETKLKGVKYSPEDTKDFNRWQ